MAHHVITEAKRCLQCKKPKCQEGCPVHTDIPRMIRLMLDGGIDEAGQMLFENNPLSMICSLICNHENQCEGHCVLGAKGSPVHGSTIENYISTYYFDRLKFDDVKKNGKKSSYYRFRSGGIDYRDDLSAQRL